MNNIFKVCNFLLILLIFGGNKVIAQTNNLTPEKKQKKEVYNHRKVSKPIGINLTSIVDYSTEFAFTDAFKQSREWIPFNADGSGPWTTKIPVALNENGFPKQIPYDNGTDLPQKVRTLLVWSLPDNAFPKGDFRLIVKGKGKVRLSSGASGTYDTPINTKVYADKGVILTIESSDVNDPISDIKFILPKYTENYQTKTFTDELLTFISDFQSIRYMDWLRTNNSTVETWSDRSTENNYTQSTKKGVAWEYVIALSNLTQKDLWINIPHKADDNYIQELAKLLKNGLDSNLKIYLEYSNEVWNGGFKQHKEAADLAQSIGYTGSVWERAAKYNAKRSADIFYAFEKIFDSKQLIKVVPSQAANSFLSKTILGFFNDTKYNPKKVTADALAIAPYFSGSSVSNHIIDNNLIETITVPEIVKLMDESLPIAFERMQKNYDVANTNGIDLIVYEGGQHLVASGSNKDNDKLTQKFTEANRHPDLQQAYCKYFNKWYNDYGGMFMHFSSHGVYGKHGSWGVKEYLDDINNPKYLSLKNCVFKDNDQSTLSTNDVNFNDEDVFTIWPNPIENNTLQVQLKDIPEGKMTFTIYDINSKVVLYKKLALTSKRVKIDVKDLSKGIYFVRMHSAKRSLTSKIIIK